MNGISSRSMESAHEFLERRIHIAAIKCTLAKTQSEHAPLWRELVRLIAQRSPDQVARMEIERGLKCNISR